MQFPISDIESQVPEKHLLWAERQMDAEVPVALQQIRRNLWTAQVQPYEVEIQLSSKNVKACTCECGTYLHEGNCAHIALALLHLRRRLIQAPVTQTVVKSKSKRIRLSSIMEGATREQLEQFILDYSRKDRNFALAFRAKFAALVEDVDIDHKYQTLVENTVKATCGNTQRISAKSFQLLSMMVEELGQQLADSASRAHYTEVWAIARACMSQLPAVLRKANDKQQLLKLRTLQMAREAGKLLASPSSPEFVADIWDYLSSNISLQSWITAGISELLLPFMEAHVGRLPEYEKAWTAALVEAIHPEAPDMLAQAPLVISLHQHYLKLGNSEGARTLMEAYLHHSDILLYTIEHSRQQQQLDRAEELAEMALDQAAHREVRAVLLQVLIEIAEAKGGDRAMARQRVYSKERFLLVYDMEDFLRLRATYTDITWNAALDQLLKIIQARPYSLERRDAEAGIYAFEKDWKKLRAYIQRIRSMDLLKNYLAPLYNSDAGGTLKLIQVLLDEYLQHHLGPQAAGRTTAVLQALSDMGAKKEAAELSQRFRDQFPERHKLVEELMSI